MIKNVIWTWTTLNIRAKENKTSRIHIGLQNWYVNIFDICHSTYLLDMNILFGYCVDRSKRICMSAGKIWFFEQFIVSCLYKLSFFTQPNLNQTQGSCILSRVNLFFKDYLKSAHQRHGKLGQVYDNLFCVILNRFM